MLISPHRQWYKKRGKVMRQHLINAFSLGVTRSMAFSLTGILAVALEAVRPFLPLLLIVVLIEAVLISFLLARRNTA